MVDLASVHGGSVYGDGGGDDAVNLDPGVDLDAGINLGVNLDAGGATDFDLDSLGTGLATQTPGASTPYIDENAIVQPASNTADATINDPSAGPSMNGGPSVWEPSFGNASNGLGATTTFQNDAETYKLLAQANGQLNFGPYAGNAGASAGFEMNHLAADGVNARANLGFNFTAGGWSPDFNFTGGYKNATTDGFAAPR